MQHAGARCGDLGWFWSWGMRGACERAYGGVGTVTISDDDVRKHFHAAYPNQWIDEWTFQHYKEAHRMIMEEERTFRPTLPWWMGWYGTLLILWPVIVLAIVFTALAIWSTLGSQASMVGHLPVEQASETARSVRFAGLPQTISFRGHNPETVVTPDPVTITNAQMIVTQPSETTVRVAPVSRSAERVIRDAAIAAGVNADQLVRIGKCESGLRADALNPTSGAAGLFQHIDTTWVANSRRYGWAGASPFNPEASANVAAAMVAHGNIGAWDASKKCWG